MVAGLTVAGVGPATASHGAAEDCPFPMSVTDASGTAVTVEEEPFSVVVLQPSAAQTVWKIGAQDKVVGMPKNAVTSYLNGTENKTNIVGERSLVLQGEVIDPGADVLIAPNVTASDTVGNLREAEQTVYYAETSQSVEDVYRKTLMIGRLVGACEGSKTRIDTMRSAVEEVRSAVSDEEPQKGLYALGGGLTAGTETFIHELVIAATSGITGYATISREVILHQNPDWIVVPEGLPLPANDAVNSTTAVQQDQFLRVNDNYSNQPAPRNTTPLGQMAKAFHPDSFTAPTATATEPSEGATATATATETAAGTGTRAVTPSVDRPGFTVVATLVATPVAALFARRL